VLELCFSSLCLCKSRGKRPSGSFLYSFSSTGGLECLKHVSPFAINVILFAIDNNQSLELRKQHKIIITNKFLQIH
jgi:hypothetical protein